MGIVECWRIIGTVAGYSHHLTVLLEQLHQSLFVSRTGATHHFELLHTQVSLLVAQCGKVRTSDTVPLNTYLATNLSGSSLCIARYYLYVYTGLMTFSHCTGYIFAYRVADGTYSLEFQMRGIAEVRSLFGGKGKCAHSMLLGIVQGGLYLFALVFIHITHIEDNLRCSLDKHPAIY